MTARIRHITIDCHDPYALSLFWTAVTGFTEDPNDVNLPEHTEDLIRDPDGSYGLLFIKVPDERIAEPRAGRRVHLDVMPTDRTRDEEVERLLGIGATVYEDHRNPNGSGWVTMADPEGNLFCVERSQAERAG
jgi:catechol 2,3-dioxygenase-like lactoylglutathione lyase family enzyme